MRRRAPTGARRRHGERLAACLSAYMTITVPRSLDRWRDANEGTVDGGVGEGKGQEMWGEGSEQKGKQACAGVRRGLGGWVGAKAVRGTQTGGMVLLGERDPFWSQEPAAP